MEHGATMKQINCIRYFWSLLQADSGHMCFGLEFPFKLKICINFYREYLLINAEISNVKPDIFKCWLQQMFKVACINVNQLKYKLVYWLYIKWLNSLGDIILFSAIDRAFHYCK